GHGHIRHRRRGRLDMDDEVRAVRVTGLGEVSLVATPGGSALVAVSRLRVVWAVEAQAGRRELGAVSPSDAVILDVELVHPRPTQGLHGRQRAQPAWGGWVVGRGEQGVATPA